MAVIYKTYSELITLPTYKQRLEYLLLYGKVGDMTFGSSRYLNQTLYKSDEWKEFREEIIIRDFGCDLGIRGRKIFEYATVHHINPITIDDVINRNPCVFDKDNVILVSDKTHKIIHYAFSLDGMEDDDIVVRKPNDTRLW